MESDCFEAKKLKLKMYYMNRSLYLLNATLPVIENVDSSVHVNEYDVNSPAYSECRLFEDPPLSPAMPRYVQPDQPGSPLFTQEDLSLDGTEPGAWSELDASDEGNGGMGGAAVAGPVLPSPSKRRRPKKAVGFDDDCIDGNVIVWIGSTSKVMHHLECHRTPAFPLPGSIISIREALMRRFRLPKSAGGCCRYRFVD